MKTEQLISPLDNRYNNKIVDLANNFSESNLNRVRFEIEIEWLIFLCSKGGKNFPALSKAKIKDLQVLKSGFDEKSAKKIKSIESKTNHDVKAVEYYIRDELKKSTSLRKYEHLVHFALTSEDVNSLSYAILMRDALIIYLKQLDVIIKELNSQNIKLNITAIYSAQQTKRILKLINKKTKVIISIFAGRAGDTGKDPIPEFKKSIFMAKRFKNVEILWASVREPYNYLQAKQLGCHIITIPPATIQKIENFGKTFDQLTKETVKAFLLDSIKSKFRIN